MRVSILTLGAIASVLSLNAYATSSTVTSRDYVDNVVATKQAKIPAQSGDYVVMYPNDENGEDDGEIGMRAIITDVSNYDEGDELVTVGAINSALQDRQDIISAGTSGNLVTYTGTAGSVGSASVYNGSNSYSGQTTSLVQAQHVNAAAANAFNAHITCNTYATPGDTTSECVLWNVNNLSGTYVPENQ
ncbi:MAG: hypothetical protein IJQ90_01865 [Alphaproteobacteria bacterium]|nr:hypothetical protein [Alphaproteobacteria bacterium]